MSLYQTSVPACIAMLTTIKALLDKAADEGDEATLMAARLAPDMYPLPKQVQLVSDSAKGCGARLAGVESPSMPDTEASFVELKDRCDKTIAFLESLDSAAVDAGADRTIELKFPNGGGMRFDGATYVAGFVLPNVYFHTTMVYAILRNAGINVGKMDFLGQLGPFVFGPEDAQ
jgi:uncharacterized protein